MGSIKHEVKCMDRANLLVVAKKLKIKLRHKMSKQALTDAILQHDEAKLRQALKVTWWDKYQGRVGVASLAITILGILIPISLTDRVSNSELKKEIKGLAIENDRLIKGTDVDRYPISDWDLKHDIRMLAYDHAKYLKDIDNLDVLVPGVKPRPTIPNVDMGDIPDDGLAVFLGDTVVYWIDDAIPACILKQGSEEMLSIDRGENGVVLSARFFDSKGLIMCDIIKNKVVINEQSGLWRADQTENSLVLWNDLGNVVLDLELINETTIRIYGSYFLRNGYVVEFAPEYFRNGNLFFENSNFMECKDGFTIEAN
jgi:hypothetical protein